MVAQYYNFLRLGFEGYRPVQQASPGRRDGLAGKIAELGPFELITDGSELPVFAFTTARPTCRLHRVRRLERLRKRGWLVPAYTFPADLQDLAVLRIVVRNGFSHDLADVLSPTCSGTSRR